MNWLRGTISTSNVWVYNRTIGAPSFFCIPMFVCQSRIQLWEPRAGGDIQMIG